MNYIGKLYGRIGKKYFDTGKTSEDWDALENNKIDIESLKKEINDNTFSGYQFGKSGGLIRHDTLIKIIDKHLNKK